jgi:hypothetical protein
VKENRHRKKRPSRPYWGDGEVGVKSYYVDEVVEGAGGGS